MRRFTRPPKRGFKLTMIEPKEDELHRSVAQALDWGLMPPALYTTFPAGWGWLPKATAGRLKACGLKPGFPDILVFYDRRCVGIELKKRDGTLSKAQKELRPKLNDAGMTVYTCRTVDEVVAALRYEDIPLRYAQRDPKGIESWLKNSGDRRNGRESSGSRTPSF